MRYAVRNRPVEEFNTEVQLPEWQLEPDEEWMFGDPDDEYYYIDEEGNLIEPTGPASGAACRSRPKARSSRAGDPARRPDPRAPGAGARPARRQPAASDDFLDRATGREQARRQQREAPLAPLRARQWALGAQRSRIGTESSGAPRAAHAEQHGLAAFRLGGADRRLRAPRRWRAAGRWR